MVYDASSTGQLDGSANYSAFIYVRQNGTNNATNHTNYAWEVRLLMSGGSAYDNDQDQFWSVRMGGGIVASGSFRLTAAQRYNTNRLIAAGTTNIPHNPDGTRPGFPVRAEIVTGHPSVGSGSSGDAWIDGPTINRLPGAPSALTLRPGTISTTCFGIDYTRNSPVAPLDRADQAQWALDPGFSSVVWTDNAAVGYTSPCGGAGPALPPGTTVFVRIRSHTAAGWGPWSATFSQTTIPAVAPGMSVNPSLSGTSATVTLTPPGSASGVTSYVIERRRTGTTMPVTSITTPTSPRVVTGLTPGLSYEWRASAMFGTYQSPWTPWVAYVQPQPNISTGEFFSGNSPATGNLTFEWNGTSGLSTSDAIGLHPTGWATFPTGPDAHGATGAVYRITGGAVSQHAARAVFFLDQDTTGIHLGTQVEANQAEISEGAAVFGSIYVRPPRVNRLAALAIFTDADDDVISMVAGEPLVVAAGQYVRLQVLTTAPEGATGVAMHFIDVDGDGHVMWLSGDEVDMDGAMVSISSAALAYFDGSTLDTSEWEFSWVGAENASPSVREIRPASSYNPLLDPDCAVPPLPPRPPVVPDDCIEDIDLWRRYWQEIPATEVTEWQSVLPTVTIRTGAFAARQVRVRVFANPFGFPIESLEPSDFCSEQTLSYIPPATVLTLDGVLQRVFAEVAGGPSLAADHLLFGSNGAPAIWPELTCGMSYYVAVDVPLDAPPGNITTALAVTRRL